MRFDKMLKNLGVIGVFLVASACHKDTDSRKKAAPVTEKPVGSGSDQTSGDPVKPNPVPGNPPASPTIPRYFAYVGGGDKISVYRFELPAGTLTLVKNLAVPTANTSFLAIHKTNPWLYAVNESDSGGVIAFSIDRDTGNLTKLNEIQNGAGGK